MMQDSVQSLIDWIHGSRPAGKKQGLSNMEALLDALGRPEANLRTVHVAGTNGKGSTCAFFESALRENGYLTGLYTSPYLTRYQERIRIGGEPTSDELMLRCGEKLRAAYDGLLKKGIYPTTFELGTALAFLAFQEAGVDVAVVETGLGGRLDPTNVLKKPMLCLIAAIGYDHMESLGHTLPEIAGEKAGIIKPGVPVALTPQEDDVEAVFRNRCAELCADLTFADRKIDVLREDARGAAFKLNTPGFGSVAAEIQLAGHHQIANAALALTGLGILKSGGFSLNKDAMLRGIAKAEWPGRLQWLSDNILIDGAHNQQGAASLRAYLDAYFQGRKKVLLTGMMGDKAYEACARTLAGAFDRVITTQVKWPKALPAKTLADVYKGLGTKAEAVDDVHSAFALARKSLEADELLVVSGSLYLVGEVRSITAKALPGNDPSP